MPPGILLHTHSVIAFIIALSQIGMLVFLMNLKTDFPALRWLKLNYFASPIWYLDQMVRFSMYPGTEGSLFYKIETIFLYGPVLIFQMLANVQIAYLFIESKFEKERKFILKLLVPLSLTLMGTLIWNELFNKSNFDVFQAISFVWGLLVFIFIFSITYRKALSFRNTNHDAYIAYLILTGASLSFFILAIVCVIFKLFSPIGYWTYFILVFLGEFSQIVAYVRYSSVFVGFQLKITAYSLLMLLVFLTVFTLVFLPPELPENIPGRLLQQNGLKIVFLIIIASVIVTCLILPALLKRTITRPLQRLLLAVRSVNLGKLDVELPVLYQDEIGSLTSQFNTMTNSLQQKSNKLIEYSDTLSELYNNQQKIQEQTLNHVSQEIHDNVGQMLSLVKIQLNLAAQKNNTPNELIAEAQENIGRAMMDLRDLAKGMSSERIRVLGLVGSVEQEAERIRRTGSCLISIECKGAVVQLEHQKETILFRVIQECLQYTLKQSRATEILLSFNYIDQYLHINIKDNGKGFLVSRENNLIGKGLLNIHHRIQLMNGKIIIQSEPGIGTNLHIEVPLNS